MVRVKSTPRKVQKRRVVLQPAPATATESNTPFGGLTKGLDTYQKVLDRLEQKYGATGENPLQRKRGQRKKRKPRRKKMSKSPEFVITPTDERLIEAATKLQHRTRQKYKRLRNTRKSDKRTAPKRKAPLSFDRRTTLLSLVRRIPDAKKPITQWLK